MLIDVRPLWAAQTNCYLLAPGPGEPGVLVDAPPDPAAVLELVRAHRVAPVGLLLTHGHVDHVGGAGRVTEAARVSAHLHPDDEWLAGDPESQLRSLFGMVPPGDFRPPDRWESLADDQVLELAGLDIRVLHTPGHTPGHCCFHLPGEGLLLSGDQLFAGSIGRTDLPGGDFEVLMRSMEQSILPLPDDTEVRPGHGPATTLARERRTNPFLREPYLRGTSA